MSLVEFVPIWETTLAHLRPRTRELNVGVAHNYLVPRFGSWRLDQIRPSDVRSMLNDELNEGRLSISAVRRHVMVLAQILDVAVIDGRLGRNAARGIRLPPEQSRPMRVLDPAEVSRLASAIDPFYRSLVLAAAYLGLRWGELTGLSVDHVDIDGCSVRVERQLQVINGEFAFTPLKTKASTRTVSVPLSLMDVFQGHMNTPQVIASELVFPSANGGPLRNASFRRIWLQAVHEADLNGLVFHELRHTAAALAIQQGSHPLAIKERMGHASITTTLDRYGALLPGLDRDLAAQLDAVFERPIG